MNLDIRIYVKPVAIAIKTKHAGFNSKFKTGLASCVVLDQSS